MLPIIQLNKRHTVVRVRLGKGAQGMGNHKTGGIIAAVVMAAWAAGCGSAANLSNAAASCDTPSPVITAPELTAKPTTGTKVVKNTKPDAGILAKPAAKPTGTGAAKPATPKPGASATAAPAPADDGAALVTAMRTKMDAATSYTATVQVLDNNKFKVKQTKSTMKITCRAPLNYRIDMVTTNNPITQGGKIIFSFGESTAKLRPGGILGMAVLTMPLSDTKITTGCEWRLDQVVAKAITERIAAYKTSLVGQTTVAGDTVKIIKLTTDSDNTLDKDIEYEQIGIDGDNLLRYWAVYAKPGVNVPNSLMWQMTLESVQLETAVTDGTFVI